MSSRVEYLTGWQQLALVVLRFAVGWHLFYQGFGKLVAVEWSSAGYLGASWGPFVWISNSPWLLALADVTMVWGLMILGVLLMIGLFTRIAAVGAIILLLMIYIAIPPLDYAGFVVSAGAEGTELYVNKALLEILALFVIVSFRTGHMLGLDILIHHSRRKSQ